MSTLAHCTGSDLCAEIAGDTDNSFVRTYEGDPLSRLILETDHFVLVADMSPLTVGHLLLLPRSHHLSFAALLGVHLAEVEQLLATIRPRYVATFGEPLVMEHGSAASSDTNACITHAHWHFIPVDGTKVDSLVRQDALPRTDITGIAELAASHWSDRPYFYTSYAGEHHVYEPSPATRRQYLRSLVGQVLSINDPEWDYALVVRKELCRETLARVRDWIH